MSDPLTNTFARNLRALRIGQDLSQEQLASRVNISTSYISMLERAQRSPPFPTLSSIAKALKVEPSYLIQELDLPDRPPARRRRRPARRV